MNPPTLKQAIQLGLSLAPQGQGIDPAVQAIENQLKTLLTIQVQLRSTYGRDLIYPINSHARTFTQFTGRKTLSETDLRLIKSLGFEIEWIPQSLTEFHDKE